VIFHLNEKNTNKFSDNYYKFESLNVDVLLKVDTEKQLERMNNISRGQQKLIHEIIGQISNFLGYEKDYTEKKLKENFAEDKGYENFSLALSECPKEDANDFIDFLIIFALNYDISFENLQPREVVNDLDKYLYMCLKTRKCAICGKHNSQIHHVDTIGMGRDRNKVDDSQYKKICLCETHHTKGGAKKAAHVMGWESFKKKYHVKGVIYNG